MDTTLALSLASFSVASVPRFQALWNCPYMGSDVAGDKFGLTSNPEGTFNGSTITLIYSIASWPRLAAVPNPSVQPCWTHASPCTWNLSLIWNNLSVVSNGGVPQAGDIALHRAGVKAAIEEKIPDAGFDGVAIFDWEEWRVLYAQNDDGLSFSRQYSIELVQRQHPTWTNASRIALEAQRQYDAGARLFFSETLRVAKELRPRGRFGFYEYPMTSPRAPEPELLWLWQQLDVLAPSDYMEDATRTAASINVSLAAVAMSEAAARASGKRASWTRPEVLVYERLWPGAKPVDAAQLAASVRVPAAAGADGIIIWGSSSDAHAPNYEHVLSAFLNSTLGPLLEACEGERARCARTHCRDHGRCASYDAAHPELGCIDAKMDATAPVCLCDSEWSGIDCGDHVNQQHPRLVAAPRIGRESGERADWVGTPK